MHTHTHTQIPGREEGWATEENLNNGHDCSKSDEKHQPADPRKLADERLVNGWEQGQWLWGQLQGLTLILLTSALDVLDFHHQQTA